ncbi:MAG: DNA recombination protein RmuC [Oscillospiraceae bacterium]|nr:DNA recombination protein RmuC [Oscillospiraceae bacterium]
MQEILLWILLVVCILIGILCILQGVMLWRLLKDGGKQPAVQDDYEALRQKLTELGVSMQATQQTASQYFEKMAGILQEDQRRAAVSLEEKQVLLGKQTIQNLAEIRTSNEALTLRTEERLRTFAAENEQKLGAVRQTVQQGLQQMQQEQERQLSEMRKVVDEKMQRVLDERMKQAFSAVNERLEQVHKGLGEMQTLAVGVGDLKKILTNVKTRGEIGEIQLASLLADVLSEGQYVQNAKLGKGVVEFAVRMPDSTGGEALLPIDAKFAGDTYAHLQDAYESGDKTAIAQAQKQLASRIRSEAQDIAEKYVDPPMTTDFGILFLPTEGLYTEAVRLGLTDEVFRRHRVFITGPTTITAILCTLQMGFQSIAVQKSGSEVWKLLAEVRTEFHKFADALARTQDKMQSASDELDKLVGVRTRQMVKRLDNVQNYLTD